MKPLIYTLQDLRCAVEDALRTCPTQHVEEAGVMRSSNAVFLAMILGSLAPSVAGLLRLLEKYQPSYSMTSIVVSHFLHRVSEVVGDTPLGRSLGAATRSFVTSYMAEERKYQDEQRSLAATQEARNG